LLTIGRMQKREKRILIVDDDDAIRTLLFTILGRRGFGVDTAPNGVDAVDALDRCLYTLVLLDLMMPQMNGWEVLEKLKERPRGSRPLVIVLTAGSEPRDLPAEIVAGTIRKPFDVDLLVDTVAACMSTLPEMQQLDGCPSPESETRFTRREPETLN
jgi:DNA-binding response OmpR family regulator